VKPLAIRASVLYALRQQMPPPAVVCVPCASSHGTDYWPPEGSMHSRVVLTPYEVDLATRLVAAVRAGAVPRVQLEVVGSFDRFLERFDEVTP
jgi:hypothetical protein